ncbi:MAG: hypothetical protein U0X91_14560 [Spirosomataceae bacterium]
MRLNWIGVLILAIAGFVLVHQLPEWKDVEFGDETTYLGSGLSFSIPFKGGAQWGPLYAAWYAFWHLFVPNALDLYYFNWALLSVLAGITVFLFFRALHTPFWVSVWLAVLFLFSAQNLPLNPKISIAPFCLILAVLAYFHFQKRSHFLRFLSVSFVGLLCAYFRPEFYISFLLGLGFMLWWAWKEKIVRHRRFIMAAGIFAGLVLLLHILLENPLFSGDGSRSAVAFQQHFVVNYCAWNHRPEPPTIEEQLRLFHQVLGNDVQTLTDALKTQPAWVAKHIFTNLTHTLTANLKNTVDTFYQTLFRGWYWPGRSALAALVALLFLGMIDYRATWRNFRQKPVGGWGLVALLTLIFPTLVATVLIYPRTHYLVFHLILIFWLIAFVAERIAFRKPVSLSTISFTPFSAVLLLIFLGIRFLEYRQPAPTPTADNVRFVSRIQPKVRLRVLERDWYRVFLRQESDWIHVEEYTDGDFVQFVRQKNINFILMTQDMQRYFAKDAGFAVFLKRYQAEGFSKLTTNSAGDYLLIKQP